MCLRGQDRAALVKRNIKATDRRITMGYLYGDAHTDFGCGYRNAWWMGNYYAEVREQHGVYISTQGRMWASISKSTVTA